MNKQEPSAPPGLLEAYLDQAGPNDEVRAPGGGAKPAWVELIEHIARLDPEGMDRRFARGDQYLREAGVLFRQYDETSSTERDWPLSHIPVVLEEREWQEISAGLIQRADLLEAIVRDLYGPATLVRDGHLPASLLAQNPAWHRPLVGVEPVSGRYLNFLSFEIGRGPDGRWWVIGDMAESPAGAGFAIENRVAMSRVFPNYFSRSNVVRLAGFFKDFQQSLFDLRPTPDAQIALLTPGPMNDHYFEHAYIARYLGLLLVEGEDLVVQDGRTMVRTVAGLKPVSLLWRRLKSAACDPLELDATSQIGTPGLVEAVRAQGVSVVNALGCGVLETRALMAFLPRISEALMGESLKMPNIATWWCGQTSALAHVIASEEPMMVGSAFSTLPLIEDKGGTHLLSTSRDERSDVLAGMLAAGGQELVAQEAVTLSTTPVWQDGTLKPRPMCLRVFLGRTADGWQVMPGGYARVSAGEDAKAFAMQRGGKVADVWVVSENPVARPSLLDSPAAAQSGGTRALTGALPSRAADNLYWLGRYVERAELHMRLFRAYFARLRDGASEDSGLLPYLRKTVMGGTGPDAAALAALFERPVLAALHSASRVGDRFSTDGMVALKDLASTVESLHGVTIPVEETTQHISLLLRQITGFSGLVHENMYRSTGWRFLSLGISIERAATMCQVLSALTDARAPAGALDLALEVGDSVMTHRARFTVSATPQSVLDLLALDPDNPRAIRYHLSRAKHQIDDLPGRGDDGYLSPLAREALVLETAIAVETPGGLTPDRLEAMQREIWALSDLVAKGPLS